MTALRGTFQSALLLAGLAGTSATGAIAQTDSSATAPDSARPAEAGPSLTGTWRLNLELSDHYMLEDRDVHRQRGDSTSGYPRGGGWGGGGGGGGMSRGGMGRRGGGGRGGYGPPGGGEERRAPNLPVRELLRDLRSPERLVIAQNDSTVSVEWSTDSADSGARDYHLDGRKVKQADGAIEEEIQANWQDARLTVNRKVKHGGKSEVTYRRQPGTGRLIELIHLQADGMAYPVDVRRVYDPASEAP